jgi:hypothetical protein
MTADMISRIAGANRTKVGLKPGDAGSYGIGLVLIEPRWD